MKFIYHGVTNKMKGDVLYPLFTLKEKHPSLYEQEIKKYADNPRRKTLPFKNINK